MRSAGRELALDHQPAGGEVVEARPARRRPLPPGGARFVLDSHLGRLARHLRLLGLDTLYRNDWPDAVLAATAAGEGRILLTRDVGLLKRRSVEHGYWLRETDPRRQAVEVLRRYGLAAEGTAFSRCLTCNGTLADLPSHEADAVPPGARRSADQFRRCGGCGQVYWRGSHHPRLAQLVVELRGAAAATPSATTR